MSAAERWRPIPAVPGYEVSDLGQVRTTDRVLADGRHAGAQLLMQALNSEGYLTVTLTTANGRRTASVHRLVLIAFRPGGMKRWTQVRHLDGNRTNNRLSNLRWGNQSMNEKDKQGGRGRKAETGEIGSGSPGAEGCFSCLTTPPAARAGWAAGEAFGRILDQLTGLAADPATADVAHQLGSLLASAILDAAGPGRQVQPPQLRVVTS